MNRLENDFQRYYQEFISQMISYLTALFDDEAYDEEWIEYMLAFLMNVYEMSYYSEVLDILNDTNVMYDETSVLAARSSIGPKSFMDSERGRLVEIFTNNFTRAIALARETKKSNIENIPLENLKETFLTSVLYDVIRLASSEIHMAQEKASVKAGEVVEEVASEVLRETTGQSTAKVTLYKTWHANMDSKTCETCAMMDGTRVKVSEAFVNRFTGEYAKLEYAGGDVTYAHPNCRCWVTYDAEESLI